jgi:PadR family transcriptional regulator, regulatory protein AphA
VTTQWLSDTEYAVLGLLTLGERSGYELDKLAGRSIGYFWRPAKSKIYAILPRLVARGLASSIAVAQERRPDKVVYRITKRGRQALRAWLDSDAPSGGPGRNPLLLKLFFGAEADPARLYREVETLKERAEQQLAELERIDRTIDREAEFFPYLTLLHGIEDARSTVAWCDRTLALLARRAGVKSGA